MYFFSFLEDENIIVKNLCLFVGVKRSGKRAASKVADVSGSKQRKEEPKAEVETKPRNSRKKDDTSTTAKKPATKASNRGKPRKSNLINIVLPVITKKKRAITNSK